VTRKLVVTGNCQVLALSTALRMIFPRDAIYTYQLNLVDHSKVAAQLADADFWIAMPYPTENDRVRELSTTNAMYVSWPPLVFNGFHPDIVYAYRGEELFRGISDYHSAIGLWAWQRGADPFDAARLFTAETFRALGYFDAYRADIDPLRAAFARSSLDFSGFWLRAKRMGVFMHTINHPRAEVLTLLAKLVAVELGATPDVLDEPIERYVIDELVRVVVWPVYPEIAVHLGVPGSNRFTVVNDVYRSREEFLRAQWTAYGDTDPSMVTSTRPDKDLYDAVLEPMLKERS